MAQTKNSQQTPEEETDELLEEIFEHPDTQRKLKTNHVLFLSFLVAVVTGLITGLLGVLVVLSGSLEKVPVLNEFSLDTILPDQQVIVRRQQAVTIAAVEQMSSVATKAQHSVVTLVETKAASQDPLSGVYTQSDVKGYGVVLTSDGWLATDIRQTEDFESTDINVITSDGSLHEVEEFIDDEISGIRFVKIKANNLLVSQVAEEYNVVSGDQLVGITSYLPSTETRVHKGVVLGYDDTDIVNETESAGRNILMRSETLMYTSPVFNLGGQLVGIYTSSPESSAVPMVIPVSSFLPAFESLLVADVVQRPYAGLEWINLHGNVGLDDDLKQNHRKGAYVFSVAPNSPADDAGLLEGDIILNIDDQELNGGLNLTEFIQSYQPGETVYMQVKRGEEFLEIDLILAEFPAS